MILGVAGLGPDTHKEFQPKAKGFRIDACAGILGKKHPQNYFQRTCKDPSGRTLYRSDLSPGGNKAIDHE